MTYVCASCKELGAIFFYLLAIISANLIVSYYGPASSIFIAFFLIGLDLSLRDYLHDKWRGNLTVKMGALILTGSIITVLLNKDAIQIAIASSAAFGIAAIGDSIVYHILRKRIFLIRANGSNVIGSVLDSTLFPLIAFNSVMPLIMLGQFIAKILGGFLWSLLINKIK